MKRRTFWKWGFGVSLTTLLFVAAREGKAEPETVVASASIAEPEKALAVANQETADSDAPAKLVSTEKPLPANIKPTSPVAELIKLANSGLTEPVMLAYVTNSVHTFNLSAEDIIYLNDIGVPGGVVTAMIQRDQEIKRGLAAGAAAPFVPEQTQPQEMAPSPGPEQMQPPESGPGYAVEAPLTPPDTGDDEMFSDSLAPYGNWVDVSGYGRCWQPTVVVANPGWQPYFNCGHWVYSDCGWYWLSDYSWGWAPFHYGSWFRHSRLGWCWVPGKTWGPSWVSWRYSEGHCGWAPLPPGARFEAGIGLTFHGRPVHDRDDFGLRPGHYHFVAWDHFNDRHLRPEAIPAHEAARIYAQSTVATRISGDGRTVINNGLPVSRVAAATHRPIHTVALRDTTDLANRGGRLERFESGGQALAVYRPRPESRLPSTLRGASPSTIQPMASPSSATPWAARNNSSATIPSAGSGYDRPSAGRAAGSLILRGAQPSAQFEQAPRSSLVIIGRGNNGQPSSPSTSSARPEMTERQGEVARSQQAANEFPQRRPEADRYQNQSPAWMGTVSSSPQPAWFGNGQRPAATAAPANPVSRPQVRTYEPVQRYQAEVPRAQQNYAPPTRSAAPAWSAPARPSYESRPAPSAPSAPPSAPASSGNLHSGSSNRGGGH